MRYLHFLPESHMVMFENLVFEFQSCHAEFQLPDLLLQGPLNRISFLKLLSC